MSDEVAIVTKAKENLIYAMSELSEKQRIALSIPKSQLIQVGASTDFKYFYHLFRNALLTGGFAILKSFEQQHMKINYLWFRDFAIIADPTFGNW